MGTEPFEACAIYADRPTEYGVATEMGEGAVNRIFNTVQIEWGTAISRVRTSDPKTDCTEIQLLPGTYRISGFSILTMDVPTEPPMLAPSNKYAGYCLVYNPADPPKGVSDLGKAIDIGSVTTAFDTAPSLFDCVFSCTEPTRISVAHQCTYQLSTKDQVYDKVYIRIATKDSLVHTFAKISILKI